MAKRKTKPDTRGPLQRVVDRERVANDQATLTVITDAQRAKGTYVGERRIVNNHDPVARWIATGKLTEGQKLAIGYVRRLWELSGLRQAVTANYGHVISGSGCTERRAALEIDARGDLRRCQGHVPAAYWNCFEDVCRWGQPAGDAGELLSAGSSRSAEVRAHQVVCFVADILVMKERL